jgi:hypothetical protein
MATVPEYQYVPVYGIDEYAPLGVPSSAQLGGGANSTNDNLMTTLWTQIEYDEGSDAPINGQLVKPVYAFGGDWFSQLVDGNLVDLPNVGLKSDLRSRYSARFALDVKNKDEVNYPLVAFLKPPQELRQMLVKSLSSEGTVMTYLRSALDNLTWNLRLQRINLEGEYEGDVPDYDAAFSSFFSAMPYFNGDGADGVFPTPFTNVESWLGTATGAKQLIDALDSGNFSVGVQVFPQYDRVTYTVEWPHSIGRG